MTQIAARRKHDALRRPAQRAMTVKWVVVLAALSVATVLDGISISDTTKPALDLGVTSQQAAITLPAQRCGPGCAIMVASNQSGDAFIGQPQ